MTRSTEGQFGVVSGVHGGLLKMMSVSSCPMFDMDLISVSVCLISRILHSEEPLVRHRVKSGVLEVEDFERPKHGTVNSLDNCTEPKEDEKGHQVSFNKSLEN